MTRIRIKMTNADYFVFESELPEAEAWESLELSLAEGEVIDFAAGRYALSVNQIVSVQILG
jgi:hypothetical protein